jgi:putative colanic acid biosynthesis acetyltransferase WcaF
LDVERDLSKFQGTKYSSLVIFKIITWNVVLNIFFKSFLFPSFLRVMLLRIFGAKVGKNVYLRRGIQISFPWNLKIGSNSWIGEEVWIINHAVVTLGSNVCISQAAVICSSGHDLRTNSLVYKHGAIEILDGGWICLGATILAGAKIGKNSVVSANETFSGALEDGHIFVNGKSKPIDKSN